MLYLVSFLPGQKRHYMHEAVPENEIPYYEHLIREYWMYALKTTESYNELRCAHWKKIISRWRLKQEKCWSYVCSLQIAVVWSN